MSQTTKKTKQAKKAGGPYPITDRLQRQKLVSILYIEEGYSAVKIAEKLGVNRNTVNEDIKECLLQLADEIPNNEIESIFLLQINALRAQKAELNAQLEHPNKPEIWIKIQKLITDIDYKIAQMVVKLMTSKREPKRKLAKLVESKDTKTSRDTVPKLPSKEVNNLN